MTSSLSRETKTRFRVSLIDLYGNLLTDPLLNTSAATESRNSRRSLDRSLVMCSKTTYMYIKE